MLPPVKGGAFSKDLERSRNAALALYERLQNSDLLFPLMKPETDIVVYAVKSANTEEMSKKANLLFKKAEENQLYLSLYKYPASLFESPEFEINSEYLTCLRSCLLKPEHDDWMDEIWSRLEKSVETN